MQNKKKIEENTKYHFLLRSENARLQVTNLYMPPLNLSLDKSSVILAIKKSLIAPTI
jgi:hypothetical protein